MVRVRVIFNMPIYGQYYGPFNPLYNGPPLDDLDAIAQKHDYGYNRQGKKSYFFYNKYDQDMLDEMAQLNKKGWSLKKRLAYAAGKTYFSGKRIYAPHYTFKESGGPYLESLNNEMMGSTRSDVYLGDHREAKRMRMFYSPYGMQAVSNSFVPTKYKTMGKKKPRNRKKPISKRIKKYVKFANTHNDWQLINSTEATSFDPYTSAINKVSYVNMHLPLASTFYARMKYQTIRDDGLGVDELAERDVNATVGAYQGKVWKFIDSLKLHIKNNTNAQANMIIYQLKCVESTDVTPTLTLQQSRDAHYSDSTTDLAITDDFNCYWSTGGKLGLRPWKLVKKYEFKLQPGEETRISCKMPPIIFDPAMHTEQGLLGYYEGQTALFSRQVGTLSHDATTASLVGISPTQLDVMYSLTKKDYMKEHQVFRKYVAPTYATDAVASAVVAGKQDADPDPFTTT